MIYSELSIEQRIKIISPKSGFWEPGFWIPFAIALFYVLALPYLFILIDLLTDDSFRKRKIRASGRRVAELNASIDVVNAEVELEKLRTEYKDVTQLNDKIQSLEGELDKSKKMVNTLKTQLKTATDHNVELSNKINDIELPDVINERTVESLENLDEAELVRYQRRVKVEMRTELNNLLKKFIAEIYNHSYDSEDNLTKRLLNQLDDAEKTLLKIIEEHKFNISNNFKLELEDNFNLLEDNIQSFALGVFRIKDLSNDLNRSFKNFYQPIYDCINSKLQLKT
ncbi:MAG: hypothetical protein ACTHOM_16900 [Allomuricauda sp.]